ncbi:hypothetical protein [Halopenitus persicus]|uniref:hypothetical protein n=1 Tax=Halopenitus persicus TaxID=1048396 RepID=UPI000AB796BB|nr:hypothetical protein [Halopenitus persicus]
MNQTLLTELDGTDTTIRISRVETPKGERLKIATPTESIALDAVALEALTWQDNAKLANLSDTTGNTNITHFGPENTSATTRLTAVSNEFGFVVVSEEKTDEDIWIDLRAKKQDESIQLCPDELEMIAHLDIDIFTDWIKTDLHN